MDSNDFDVSAIYGYGTFRHYDDRYGGRALGADAFDDRAWVARVDTRRGDSIVRIQPSGRRPRKHARASVVGVVPGGATGAAKIRALDDRCWASRSSRSSV